MNNTATMLTALGIILLSICSYLMRLDEVSAFKRSAQETHEIARRVDSLTGVISQLHREGDYIDSCQNVGLINVSKWIVTHQQVDDKR